LAFSVLPLLFIGAFPVEMLEKVQIQGSNLYSFVERLAIIGVIYASLLIIKFISEDRMYQAADISSNIYLILIIGLFSSGGNIGQLKVTSTLGGVENTLIMKTGFFSLLIITSLIASTIYSVYEYSFKKDQIKDKELDDLQDIP
jgi:hypothetical protein